MIEKFVAIVYLNEHPLGFDISPEFGTYQEALMYINNWSVNSDFDYGTVEKRFRKGEAQPINPDDVDEDATE